MTQGRSFTMISEPHNIISWESTGRTILTWLSTWCRICNSFHRLTPACRLRRPHQLTVSDSILAQNGSQSGLFGTWLSDIWRLVQQKPPVCQLKTSSADRIFEWRYVTIAPEVCANHGCSGGCAKTRGWILKTWTVQQPKYKWTKEVVVRWAQPYLIHIGWQTKHYCTALFMENSMSFSKKNCASNSISNETTSPCAPKACRPHVTDADSPACCWCCGQSSCAFRISHWVLSWRRSTLETIRKEGLPWSAHLDDKYLDDKLDCNWVPTSGVPFHAVLVICLCIQTTTRTSSIIWWYIILM